MDRKRIVIAGLGDAGILAAVRLAGHADVVGISVKDGLVSGQELGMRVSRPEDWARDYFIGFRRFRGLDPVRIVHGSLTSADLDARTVTVNAADGTETVEPFDVLLISTGTSNGFWRSPTLQSSDDVEADLKKTHERLASARRIAVVGGGATAVSSAGNLARTWPDKQIDLYFPGAQILPGYHTGTQVRVARRLAELGVRLHLGHRAILPVDRDEITTGPIEFSTDQPDADADAVLWAVGRVRPNTGWLPADVLDGDGFVRVTPELTVPGHPRIFAVGDVAATDPLRTSARNGGGALVARNILAQLESRKLRRYRPPSVRWGSVLGPQSDGLEVFTPWGQAVRFPAWTVDPVLQRFVVRRQLYRGVRD
ncbi:pyridine nucleotide-disulfide oxidoreductase [Mycobacterium sp. CBMA293]|uniref:NAD(P)/FAD-dependent oxidoreductase n=2 Tax=Mycolicibacterium TaxID=1866885 RepID=UPI0012DC7254|nr:MULTISPECIES: FAD-dependent oxidoreductase [unclassified Mycolicibacterium]MUL47315.1 pyridine nucleotide-disulfide oxidoreductase [Mycolicibacterium sp. CBMA 360]MUL61427.1 pyridine nucleotide-disulfide oxidoreductase [Mycolicibacterium sp. CBMA 335]MUL72162.1 pyridine nucleotide-disulfide oxidoreductase [Mycolicibacterium sp. CBMA 311]MUL96329.1 pyridine nucleotide-disulfide oxidoreductase [Mycolicibacterium sp. CBMA 230]MUM08848.1 pyridine nucleotide-disulfide oxidoreductase [Mycolicibac